MTRSAKHRLVVVFPGETPVASEVRELKPVDEVDRIARLRRAISENRLHIDARAIAEAILDEE